tara:strand:- start:1815 stop:2273 length:459 start_codon:yes stop_codon:yes gene_type:complete
MNPDHFLKHVIRPTISSMDMHSQAAERLLLCTAIVESNLEWLKQHGGGPALGVYQMEPATVRDIYHRYLSSRELLKGKIEPFITLQTIDEQLVTNLAFATGMARMRYWMVPDALPAANDGPGLADYWKQHYNTAGGKGNPAKFAAAFKVQFG